MAGEESDAEDVFEGVGDRLDRSEEATETGWRELLSRDRLSLRHWLGLLGFAGLAALPGALTPVQLSAMVGAVYLMLFAMSWDFVSGYTGQISLGHAMFFGMGGYATTVLNLQHGVNPVLAVPIATLLAALLGLLIGVPALRLRGPYLSLVTLVVPLIMLQSTILFSDGLPVLAPGGLQGTGGFILSPDPFVGTQARSLVSVGSFRVAVIADYYIAFALLVAVFAALYAITRSDTGDVFTAIREDEEVVAAVGLNPAKFKIFAFVVSGAVGGLVGAMFVHSSAGHPLPDLLLELRVSLQVIVMAVIGGMGTIVGAMVGAAFFLAVNQLMNSLSFTIPIVNRTPEIIEPIPVFVVGVLVLLLYPRGIVPGLVAAGRRTLARYRGEPEPEGESGPSPVAQVVASYRDALSSDEE